MKQTVSLMPQFLGWDLHGKRVFLRADLNISPTASFEYALRLKALKPTLDFLLKQHATIILATHWGRPRTAHAKLSTQQLIPWLLQQGYPAVFAPDLESAYQESMRGGTRIIVLENLRFFPGEQANDLHFAQQLARLADYYVNDAFGVLHRAESSIVQIPLLFPPEKRSIGFLVEKELALLNTLHNPQKPFVLILGGGKVSEKIALLRGLLPSVQVLLLCPAIAFTFLASLEKPIGKSLVEHDTLDECKKILKTAHRLQVKVVFPSDYLIAYDTFNGPLATVAADAFPENAIGIAIGPETIAHYVSFIHHAKTVLYNGLMGSTDRPETLGASQQLFDAMAANTAATTIIGGGDSTTAALLHHLDQTAVHLTTGGGSTLAYISGSELPGLQPFLKDRTKSK
jgi:phosphoglycerate kinase